MFHYYSDIPSSTAFTEPINPSHTHGNTLGFKNLQQPEELHSETSLQQKV